MLRRWKTLLKLLRTPLGRLDLRKQLWERSWPALLRAGVWYRRDVVRRTRVVAVVGSFGKSTTLSAVTVALGRKVHPLARLNATASLARAVLRVRPWHRHAVIEAGIAAPGEMARYARLVHPDITVVTSIGSDHHRSLKTLEVTRHEKADMVRELPLSGLAVLNGDDPNVLWMRGETRARIITFGFEESNDVRATDLVLDWPTGIRFTVRASGRSGVVRTRLIGKHMAYPILAAAAVALAEGFTLDEIIPRLEGLSSTPGRMEPIRLPNGAIVLRDEFKSSLETIDSALDALALVPVPRRFVVMGEVSDPPGSKGPIYRRLGDRIAQIATRVVFVGQGSAWSPVASGAKRGGMPHEKLFNAGEDIAKAIEILRRELGPGDVALVKGRSTQHLERITLALQGHAVRCTLKFCDLKVRCAKCPMLERGWPAAPLRMKHSPAQPESSAVPG